MEMLFVVRGGRWSRTTRAYATANARQRQLANLIATSSMVHRTARVERVTGVELSVPIRMSNARRQREADARTPYQAPVNRCGTW